MLAGLLVALGGQAEPAEPSPPQTPAEVAQGKKAKAPQGKASTANEDVEVDFDSPRMAVKTFLGLVDEGKDVEASRYLQGASEDPAAADLAHKLAAVLQSLPDFDAEALSPSSEGDPDDGLRQNRDRIAGVRVGAGGVEPVRMVKVDEAEGWRFAPGTVKRIAAWYERLPGAWVQQRLPSWLSRRGPAGMQTWQWLALLALVVVAWGVGFLVSRVVSRVLTALVKKTAATWDDAVLELVQGPVTLACSLGIAAAAIPWLSLRDDVSGFLTRVVKGGFLIVFFWLCLKAVDVSKTVLTRARFASDRPASRSLISLGARFTKAALFVVLVIAVLSLLGLPVGSLLAGLGIGGLAVALAGQKTLENLLGTFAIGFDQPFREGDFVKIRDFVGTVEAIGLRSTRIRTLDRTIISVPNGKLADEQVETFAARDRLRLFCVLGLRYGSSPEQLRATLAEIDAALRTRFEKVDASTVVIRLVNLAEWSIGVEVAAMVDTSNWDEFTAIRQQVLLHVMSVLEEGGVKLQPLPLLSPTEPSKGNNGAPRALTNM